MQTLADLLDLQSGVVSRRQVLAAPGESDASIRRRLRRRTWVPIHPGVYVDHTGPPTWLQRAWAAVLYAWPAALYGDSAIRAGDGPGRRDRPDEAPIHVAVAHGRTVRPQSGVVVHRVSEFEAKAQSNLSPPRLRVEYAVLDAAADARDDLSAVGILSDAVRSRRTTPSRLLGTARGEARLRRRSFLIGVLADASEGTCSALEVEYLRRVERAHGLPSAGRQLRDSLRGTVYRDVEYVEQGLIVELDGQLGHTSTRDRDDDMERDLDAALTSRTTVRLGWGQVHERACSSARKIALLLRQRGWTGAFRPCRRCRTTDMVDFSSACDEKSTMSVA